MLTHQAGEGLSWQDAGTWNSAPACHVHPTSQLSPPVGGCQNPTPAVLGPLDLPFPVVVEQDRLPELHTLGVLGQVLFEFPRVA